MLWHQHTPKIPSGCLHPTKAPATSEIWQAGLFKSLWMTPRSRSLWENAALLKIMPVITTTWKQHTFPRVTFSTSRALPEEINPFNSLGPSAGLHNIHMCRCLCVWIEQPKPISFAVQRKWPLWESVTGNNYKLCISSNLTSLQTKIYALCVTPVRDTVWGVHVDRCPLSTDRSNVRW